MIEFLPWYISGAIIGLCLLLLLLWTNKQLGISSSIRHLCAASGLFKTAYFSYDWRAEGAWNLKFILGLFLAGLAMRFIGPEPDSSQINPETIERLKNWGIDDVSGIMPPEVFDLTNIYSMLVFGLLGGFLIGFGVRYANGCTSGHAIMGLSLGSRASLIATISFFIGGLLMSHFLLKHLIV